MKETQGIENKGSSRDLEQRSPNPKKKEVEGDVGGGGCGRSGEKISEICRNMIQSLTVLFLVKFYDTIG